MQYEDEKGRKKLCELENYFTNNWDSIVERMSGDHPESCTEPLISHLLSERLSRNPLAWSKEGLGKMAMLRIFTQNGGKITAEHIRVSRSKKERAKDHHALKNGLEIYSKYAEKQVEGAIGGCYDWSIFEKACKNSIMSGKLTGTTLILKAFAKMRTVDFIA